MKGNKYPLASSGDFGMYYNGTYVFAYVNGQPRAMYVEGVERAVGGDETQLEGVVLFGMTYSTTEEVGYERWTADQIEDFRPISGYCDLGGPVRDKYVTYNVPNRTQKKGLDSRNILVNGRAYAIRGSQMARLFDETSNMVSNPAARDFLTMADSRVFWKGTEIGKMEGNTLVCNETHKTKEAVLWRLLQNS